jgi:hypothetical protein
MPNTQPYDPLKRRPGHFERFEFLNMSATDLDIAALTFHAEDSQNVDVWMFSLAPTPHHLAMGQNWEVAPAPGCGGGNADHFTATVDFTNGLSIHYAFTVQNMPPDGYITDVSLMVSGGPTTFVGFGFVTYMAPNGVSLQPADITVTQPH